MPSKKITSPHVTGHTIEHSGTDGMPIRTNMAAQISHGTLRLEIKSGSATIKILASDWDFFKKQGDELLGKRRLLESATK